jgi:hypothetical protein
MTSATERVSTWSYLCDTCDNFTADIGERDCGTTIFCKRHKGSTPKLAISDYMHPAKVCRYYRPKEVTR